MESVLIGLSGGIDSSMSAKYLKDSGYKVRGLYFKVHPLEENHKKALENVDKVSKYLGIDYEVVDLKKEFNDTVFQNFLQRYQEGLTPNPCVICNREIKFKKVLEIADQLQCDKIATGHYVRNKDGFLHKGVDSAKDQSYFLFNIEKKSLGRILFPLGEKIKDAIKKEAMQIPLFRSIAEGRESSEICFVNTDYTDLIQQHLQVDQTGNALDENGQIVGTHKGYMHYTVGKRRGFDIPLSHDKLYVKSTNPADNTITIAKRESLFADYLEADNLNMFIDDTAFECKTKIRYNGEPISANVTIMSGLAKITLKKPAFAIAKGQSAVFYQGNKLIGGGFIL